MLNKTDERALSKLVEVVNILEESRMTKWSSDGNLMAVFNISRERYFSTFIIDQDPIIFNCF